MFLFLALFTVTPNLGGTFRLGKNPTSLTLIKDHCVESFFFVLFLLSNLKEHISLTLIKDHCVESEIILFSYFYIERVYITACVQVLV